jgi:hypothetical protein
MNGFKWLIAAGLLATTAACTQTAGYPSPSYGYYNSGYYSGSGYYRSRPYYYNSTAYSRRGPGGDYDRDGVANRYDRDANGDGVPDRYQR